MSNPIIRRDFLGGAELVIAGGLSPLAQLRADPWNAYTHEAIDQAWRAVNELKTA